MTDILTKSTGFPVEVNVTHARNDARSLEKTREAAEEFEAFFLSQFLNSMTSGLQTDGMFGGGESEKVFRGMLNEEYAKTISRQNGIGVADAVFREMLAMQEV
ncbi:MAG: rod-binding protein [Proteobacteria bacterium]|nr:rod-binding protein [Pseudomonadota bacterium]